MNAERQASQSGDIVPQYWVGAGGASRPPACYDPKGGRATVQAQPGMSDADRYRMLPCAAEQRKPSDISRVLGRWGSRSRAKKDLQYTRVVMRSLDSGRTGTGRLMQLVLELLIFLAGIRPLFASPGFTRQIELCTKTTCGPWRYDFMAINRF